MIGRLAARSSPAALSRQRIRFRNLHLITHLMVLEHSLHLCPLPCHRHILTRSRLCWLFGSYAALSMRPSLAEAKRAFHSRLRSFGRLDDAFGPAFPSISPSSRPRCPTFFSLFLTCGIDGPTASPWAEPLPTLPCLLFSLRFPTARPVPAWHRIWVNWVDWRGGSNLLQMPSPLPTLTPKSRSCLFGSMFVVPHGRDVMSRCYRRHFYDRPHFLASLVEPASSRLASLESLFSQTPPSHLQQRGCLSGSRLFRNV